MMKLNDNKLFNHYNKVIITMFSRNNDQLSRIEMEKYIGRNISPRQRLRATSRMQHRDRVHYIPINTSREKSGRCLARRPRVEYITILERAQSLSQLYLQRSDHLASSTERISSVKCARVHSMPV